MPGPERLDPPGDVGGGLQFDHAEFDPPAPATAFTPTVAVPVEVVLAAHDGPTGGRGFLGFLAALALGLVAAAAGSVILFAVAHFLHITSALVAILIGYVVGKAVRRGSGDLGGRAYQVLAVALTYSAVAWGDLMLLLAPVLGQKEAAEAILTHPSAWPPLLLLAYQLPVLGLGSLNGLIGLLILFWGMQQAWRMNAGRPRAWAVAGRPAGGVADA